MFVYLFGGAPSSGKMGNFLSFCPSKHKTVDIRGHMIQLKGQRDELEEYRVSLLARINELEGTILEHVHAGERDKALIHLRRKALLRSQLSKIDTYLYQVLTVISDTEMAQVNLDVYEQLKIGADLLQTLSQRIDLAEIESIKDIEQRCREDMEEAHAIITHEIRAVDEAALLKELEQLTKQGEALEPLTVQSNTNSGGIVGHNPLSTGPLADTVGSPVPKKVASPL